MNYYFSKRLELPFEEALNRIGAELKKEGFGILTEIDVQQVFQEKIGVDFPRYRILGACNPAFAYRAIQAEDKIGTMLPCNIIVQELKSGEVEVTAIDPLASMQAVDNPELKKIAAQVQEKLKKVIESM